MKKTIRKVLTILLSVVLLVCVLGMIACDKDETSIKYTVSIDKKEISLNLFDEYTLKATGEYEGDLVWSTSDASIVTIDNGLIKGVGVGSAVVKVTVGEGESAVSDQCNVTVSVTGDLSLLVNYEKITLDKGQSITLTAGIFVNSNDVGANYTFTTDSSILETENVSNGRFYIKAIDYGEATVNVKTTYLGVEYEKNISISIKENVTLIWNTSGISINEGVYSIMIDRMNTSVSPAVKNSVVLDMSVFKSGEEIQNPNIAWSIDKSEVLSISGNVITVVGFGTATVTAKYTSNDGNEFVKELEITVDPGEVVEITESKFVQIDDTFYVEGNLIENAYDIYSANRLFNKDVGWKANGEFEVYAESGVNFYKLTVQVVDLVISNVNEFKQFVSEMKAATTAVYTDKYVVLDCDLDLINSSNLGIGSDLNQSATVGFGGTFDGRNHTIYGGNYGQSGMFKGITATGVVKNLNIVAPTIKWGYSGVIAGTVAGTLENINVVMNAKQSTSNAALSEASAYAYKTTSTARYTKCSIYCFDLPDGYTTGSKSLGFAVIQSFQFVGTDPNCNVLYSQTADNVWHDSNCSACMNFYRTCCTSIPFPPTKYI